MSGILNIFFIVIDIYKSAEEFGDIWDIFVYKFFAVDCCRRTQWTSRTFQRPNKTPYIIPTEAHYKAKTERSD